MSLLDYQTAANASAERLGFRWLGWAVFLGMSWTWCIGMFLPVLLVRDYGVWGWAIFAVPNVVGAAAMGWVLSAEGSRQMVQSHRIALSAFSLITIAFQIFFVGWAFDKFGLEFNPTFAGIASGALLLGALASRRRWTAAVAICVLFVSVFCWTGISRDNWLPRLAVITDQFRYRPSLHQAGDLAALGPVCLFGFALCPYGDLTFHRARRQLNARQSQLAFGVGFGVVFLVMIVLSLLYAVTWRDFPGVGIVRWIPLLGLHWLVQIGYTIGLHLAGDGTGSLRRRGIEAVCVGLGAVVVAALSLLAMKWMRWSSFDGESVYRVFLAFYGLVFPAYMWLCVIPTRGRVRPSPESLRVCAAAVILAAPMYWMGFFEKEMLWLLPGLALVLWARWFLPQNPTLQVRPEPPAPQQNSAPIS